MPRIHLTMHGGADGDSQPPAATVPFRPVQVAPLAPTPPPPALSAPRFQQFTAAATAHVSDLTSNWVVLAVIVCLVVLGMIMWWLVRRMLRGSFGTQTSVSLVTSPAPTDVYRKFSVGKFPSDNNGQRMTMSFWMYVSDFSKNNGSFQHVLHVGQEDGTVSSPLVFLDRNKNRLIVWFSKTSGTNPQLSDLLKMGSTKLNGDNSFDVNNHGIIIPYIPQQRWVNVSIVVDETVQATTITGYVDAEVVVQVTTGDSLDDNDGYPIPGSSKQYASSNSSTTKDLRFLNLSLTLGDLYTGGDVFSRSGPGFPGYISRVSFFNYDLNSSDILKLYHNGPYANSWLQRFGIGAYGVRSPVYRITDGSVVKANA